MFDEELLKALQRFQINYEEPEFKINYTPFNSILQEGPQCGLIAFAMYLKYSSNEQIEELFKSAKSLNFTINGEMFSCENMLELIKINTRRKVELYCGNLENEKIIEFLFNNGVLLVPYDADANHSPCMRNGHKAHWALITGVIKTSNNEILVIARQGKSKYLGIWSLKALSESNAQLNEFSPSRKDSNLEYILPVGGISGPKGLKSKCILIYDQIDVTT